jgi:hypothetical protein
MHLIFCEVGMIGRELAKSGIFDVDEFHNEEEVVHIGAPHRRSSHDLDLESRHMETVAAGNRSNGDEPLVHNFKTLDQALEYSENCLLSDLYKVKAKWIEAGKPIPHSLASSSEGVLHGRDISSLKAVPSEEVDEGGSLHDPHQFFSGEDTPRTAQTKFSAIEILRTESQSLLTRSKGSEFDDPVIALGEFHPVYQILSASIDDLNLEAAGSLMPSEYVDICSKFERVDVYKGCVLWFANQPATELYIVESGELSQLIVDQGKTKVVETLMPGTMVSSHGLSFTVSNSEKIILIFGIGISGR